MSKFSNKEQKYLLQIARQAIVSKIANKDISLEEFESELFEMKCGAFVTITNNNKLRGCVGLLTSDFTLPETIANMAEKAATLDRRFAPIDFEELKDINLEISVLSPFKTVSNIKNIEVGIHGIYISSGHRNGLLLPQVAVANKWDKQEFLEHTCIKAGLSTQAWKDNETTIQIFTAELFDDKSD